MCWGKNDVGQLGDGSTAERNVPNDVSGLTSGVVSIKLGMTHTCALLSAGGIKCWGQNVNGQLGDNTTTSKSTPTDVVGLTNGVQAIGTGWFTTCAVTSLGGAKCWGQNNWGEVGDGTTGNNRTTPVNVSGFGSGAAATGGGSQHSCGLTSSGGVLCWGDNSFGQLGDGTTVAKSTPVSVSGLGSGVTMLEVDHVHALVRTSVGGVKFWGNAYYGEAGDGTSGAGNNKLSPIDVPGLSGVIAVAAGADHNCALLSGGGIKCWGSNSNGQLGDGTVVNKSTPVDVSGLTTGVLAISAGGAHTCALLSNSSVKCWGSNSNGQLGDGTTTQRNAPVYVLGFGQ
jgi:hypothetical protein